MASLYPSQMSVVLLQNCSLSQGLCSGKETQFDCIGKLLRRGAWTETWLLKNVLSYLCKLLHTALCWFVLDSGQNKKRPVMISCNEMLITPLDINELVLQASVTKY